MTKQTTTRWQSLLLATIAAFIVLGASDAVFAQKADKYPKPDFSAMEEYFEIVEWEYDFSNTISKFSVIVKKKVEKIPASYWTVTWRDAKGLKIYSSTITFVPFKFAEAKVGEPVEGQSYAPWKSDMNKVKTVVVIETEN